VIQSLNQLLARLTGYSPFELVFELAAIAIVVYLVVRFLRGTRGAGVIKGLALLLVFGTLAIRVLGQGDDYFQRLNFLYDRTLGFMAIALLVVFQPELRRALMRLGEASWLRRSNPNMGPVIEAVTEACRGLSRRHHGALIAIERSVGLRGLVEGGVVLNAEVSARFLESIFWPSNPLHDLGVIISEQHILAANVQFPLVEDDELARYRNLGSRHRAALCLSRESDGLIIIVSEEQGTISVAERGRLFRRLTPNSLRQFLEKRLLDNEPITNSTDPSTDELEQDTQPTEEPDREDLPPHTDKFKTEEPPDESNKARTPLPTKPEKPTQKRSLIARLETIIVVAIVTVIIWTYAESQNLGDPYETEVQVVLSVLPDSNLIPRRITPDRFHIEIAGPQRRVDEVKQGLAEGRIDLTVGLYGIPTSTKKPHQLLIEEVLMQHPVFHNKGISVRSVDSPTVQIIVDRWADLGPVDIEPGSLGDIEVDGPITLDPPRTNVYVAESLLTSLTPERTRLVAEPNLNELAKLSEGHPHTIDTQLTFPAIADITQIQFDQSTVRMTLTIKSKRDFVTKNTVPIKIAKTHDGEQEYIVTLTHAFIPEVRLVGPSDVIARIRNDQIKIIGYIDLSPADLATGVTEVPVAFPYLPDSVTIESGPHKADVTITKRPEPTTPPASPG